MMLSSGLLLLFQAATAGALRVEAVTAPVVVVLDGAVIGPAPVERIDLVEGRYEVGFRATTWSQTVLTESVDVPAQGVVVLMVDLSGRKTTQRIEATPAPDMPALPSAAEEPTVPSPPPVVPRGDLYVASVPPGARIILDGQETGQQTPALLSGVTPGTYTVDLRTDCARGRGNATVRDGLIGRIELDLKEGQGTLSLETDPPGAEVLLDGKDAGVTPAVLPHLACGVHGLVLRAPGRIEVAQEISIRAYEQNVLSLALPIEQFGTLAVAPTPLEAEVSLDGVVVGTGPRTIEQVGVGDHALDVSYPDYMPDHRVVEVLPDQVLRVDVSLVSEDTEPERHFPWGRVAVNTATTSGGIALAGMGIYTIRQAKLAYQDFLQIEDDAEAEGVYQDDVLPRRRLAIAEGAGSVALLAGAVALWGTTDFRVAPSPTGIAVMGRW